MKDILKTAIYKRLKSMHENKQPLVLDGISLLVYWNIIPPLVQIELLKRLSQTEYGITFRGEKITCL